MLSYLNNFRGIVRVKIATFSSPSKIHQCLLLESTTKCAFSTKIPLGFYRAFFFFEKKSTRKGKEFRVDKLSPTPYYFIK